MKIIPQRRSQLRFRGLEILGPAMFMTSLLYVLRTPVMVIQGYTQILSNEARKEHHLRAVESLANVADETKQILNGIAEYRNELQSRRNT